METPSPPSSPYAKPKRLADWGAQFRVRSARLIKGPAGRRDSPRSGDWSKPFTTPKWLQVDQFDGQADRDAIGALIWGLMRLKFKNELNPFSGAFSVNVPTGFSKGFGVEGSKAPGPFKLVPGSVKVFKGP